MPKRSSKPPADPNKAAYNEPIQRFFHHRADHGTEVKDYGLLDDDAPERKYSPMVVKSVLRTPIYGMPDPDHISTAYVERQNLTMRMSMPVHPANERLLEEG